MNKETAFWAWIIALFPLTEWAKMLSIAALAYDWPLTVGPSITTALYVAWMGIGSFVVPATLRGPDFD